MHAAWDESYLNTQREAASIYWVCFWAGDDVQKPASHDPQRITGAGSVAEVLEWVSEVRKERRFELFVATRDRAETRTRGWIDFRKLIRLAGDFKPEGVTSTVTLSAPERQFRRIGNRCGGSGHF